MSATKEQRARLRDDILNEAGEGDATVLIEALEAVLADSERLAEVEKAARTALAVLHMVDAGAVWINNARDGEGEAVLQIHGGIIARVRNVAIPALLDAVNGDTPQEGS